MTANVSFLHTSVIQKNLNFLHREILFVSQDLPCGWMVNFSAIGVPTINSVVLYIYQKVLIVHVTTKISIMARNFAVVQYITIPDDLRLSVSRDSKCFKSSYSLYTECERYNSRFKNTVQDTFR